LAGTGPGSFALGSGCIDFDGLLPEGEGTPAVKCLQEAVDFFTTMTAGAGCDYRGELTGKRMLPTIVGTYQPASYAPSSVWVPDPALPGTVAVVGVRGLTGFNAEFIAERLSFQADTLGFLTRYHARMIELPRGGRQSITAYDAAVCMEMEESRRELAAALQPAAEAADLVILPGILGIKVTAGDLGAFGDAVGCPVCEMATMPPSVPGLRVYHHLLEYLQKTGVELNLGHPVRHCLLDRTYCTAVSLATPGRDRLLPAKAVVIATGQVVQEGEPGAAGIDLPFDLRKDGIKVNRQLQPLNKEGAVIADNVYVAGSILGGNNPKNGNAAAITTGCQAGISAAKVVGYNAKK